MSYGSFVADIATALVLGMAIGLERQWRSHPAGLRTNSLVSLGAALFVSLSVLMNDVNSPTRVAAYVVSGLGFLGGGVILRDGLNVKGMNTAATIWGTGAIGTLCGAGFLLEALTGTAAILTVHLALRPVVEWVDARRKISPDVSAEAYYRLRVVCRPDHDARIRHILLRHVGGSGKLSLQGISTEETEDQRTAVVADMFAVQRNDRAVEDIVARVSIEPDVTAVSWQRSAG